MLLFSQQIRLGTSISLHVPAPTHIPVGAPNGLVERFADFPALSMCL